MTEAIAVTLFAYFGTGFLLSLQVLLSYLSARSALKSNYPEWRGEGAQVLHDLSCQRGGAWGTMGIVLIAPWYVARLPEGIIR